MATHLAHFKHLSFHEQFCADDSKYVHCLFIPDLWYRIVGDDQALWLMEPLSVPAVLRPHAPLRPDPRDGGPLEERRGRRAARCHCQRRQISSAKRRVLRRGVSHECFRTERARRLHLSQAGFHGRHAFNDVMRKAYRCHGLCSE